MLSNKETNVRPVMSVLAREMTKEDLEQVAGGGSASPALKCAPTGGACGTKPWDVGIDDSIGF